MVLEVPDGWTAKRIGQLGAAYPGLSGKTKSDFGAGKPFVTYTQVFKGERIELDACDLVAVSNDERQHLVRFGDVLFTASSETREEVAYSAVVLEEVPELYLNSFCFGFRPHSPDELSPEFSSYFFRGPEFRRAAVRLGQGSTRINISKKRVLDIVLPIPPLPEQRKIATILSSVDDAITATRKVIEQTQRVKQGLLQTLMTRGIGHTRFKKTEIGEIPEGWEVCSLGEVLASIDAGKSPAASSEPAGSDNWGVLKVSAVGADKFFPNQNKTLPEDYSVDPAHRVMAGDVLISRANTAELVGATCLVPDGDYRLMLSDKTLRLKPDMKRLTPEFMTLIVNTPKARAYLGSLATGSSASMKNLSQAKIRSLPVAIPTLSEQQVIESHFASCRSAIEAGENNLAKLETLRAGLMQDLLTGRVRVPLD